MMEHPLEEGPGNRHRANLLPTRFLRPKKGFKNILKPLSFS